MAKHTVKIPLDKDCRVTTGAPAFYSVFNYDGLELTDHQTREASGDERAETWQNTRSKEDLLEYKMVAMKVIRTYLTKKALGEGKLSGDDDMERWEKAWVQQMWVQLHMEDPEMAKYSLDRARNRADAEGRES